MKKILSIFVVLMYMLSGISIAYAQEETTTSVEAEVTAEETSTETPEEAAVSEETTSETTVTEEETVPEAVVTSEPVPEATEDSGITTVVTASDGTVISDTEVADVVETEEDAAEVTATEEAVETAEEVESMTASPDGVEVRLTQLQERIERAIAHGEEIIATASADNASVESLQASLDALVALKAEAAAIPTTGDVSEITAQFVAVKKAVIDAVKDFRTEARKLIKENKRAALKARMEAKAEARTARLEAKINSAKKRYNAEVTETVLARFGEEGATIAAKIESGEISAKDARKEIVAAYKSLSSDKKSEARQKLTERKAEIKVKRSAAVEKAKERTVEEVKTRGKKNE